jgi:hypothetical protein
VVADAVAAAPRATSPPAAIASSALRIDRRPQVVVYAWVLTVLHDRTVASGSVIGGASRGFGRNSDRVMVDIEGSRTGAGHREQCVLFRSTDVERFVKRVGGRGWGLVLGRAGPEVRGAWVLV